MYISVMMNDRVRSCCVIRTAKNKTNGEIERDKRAIAKAIGLLSLSLIHLMCVIQQQQVERLGEKERMCLFQLPLLTLFFVVVVVEQVKACAVNILRPA